jgi:steroid delta-isomerase-like uncharacterized protein
MGADADLIRRLTDEVFLDGRVEAVDELLADDFVSHDAPPGISPDRKGFRALAEMVTSAFSDRKMEFDELVDTSDGRVVDSWAMLGTHTGEAFGLPPSNEVVRVRGIELWRCAGGKVVEHWGAVDMADLFEKAQGG